jgi:aldose 1-epimerase
MNYESIRLRHNHRPPNGPFYYQAEQTFRIEPYCMRVELSVRNEGKDPMPYGIGVHPWMPAPPDTQLQFKAEHVFLPDETALPRSPQPVDRTIDFASSRRVSDLRPLDAKFAGWGGQAVVLWPEDDYSVEVSAHGAFCALHVFAPADRQVICVEPVSHVPNAHNRPEWTKFGHLYILHEAEILRGEMIIRPSAHQAATGYEVKPKKPERAKIGQAT